MKMLMNIILVLMLLTILTHVRSQSDYFSSGIAPKLHTTHAATDLSLQHSDLNHNHVLRRRAKSKYPLKAFQETFISGEDVSNESHPSEEYSSEMHTPYSYKERDNPAYTKHLQHSLITSRKLSTSQHKQRPSQYSTIDDFIAGSRIPEAFAYPKSRSYPYSAVYDPEDHNFHITGPSKSSTDILNDYHGYNIGGDYILSDIARKRLLANLREQFKSVASKKQIEKYLEDQEKLLDHMFKLELLNSPRFQKLLKLAENDEFDGKNLDDDYENSMSSGNRGKLPKSPPFKSRPVRRRPGSRDIFKRSSKPKPVLNAPKPHLKVRKFLIEV